MEFTDEVYTGNGGSISVDTINEISYSICEIEYSLNLQTYKGTGFFMNINSQKLNYFKEILSDHFLITNCHVIEPKVIFLKKDIKIKIQNEKTFTIKLDSNQRIIKCYKKPVDITII